MHAALLWQVISLSSIAGAAGGDHVRPVVVAATRERNEVVARQTLAVPQLGMAPVAVLAAVTISGKEECVGDLTTEAAGNVDELDESDSTISALPSITRRSARRTGTIVNGSKEAFNARHRTVSSPELQ
jgi:hypothetical protein